MTRDLKPTRHDLWRLVENYGSITHAAQALGVANDELKAWLAGTREIPSEHYEALVALVAALKKQS